MKKAKFLLIFILPTLMAFSCLFGCNKALDLMPYVTELKSDIFTSQNSSYNLKANYGYKTYNGTKIYNLTFIFMDNNNILANVTYSISLDYNGVTYKKSFTYSPVSHNFVAKLEVPNFIEKEFNVSLLFSSENINITMKSCLPENTISPSTALKNLVEKQPSLIKTYLTDTNIFLGEITLRVLVKDEKPYWYIGLFDEQGNLKALLIDGFTGDLLAIREIF